MNRPKFIVVFEISMSEMNIFYPINLYKTVILVDPNLQKIAKEC